MRRTVRVGEAFYHIKGRRLGWIRESMLEIWLILTANRRLKCMVAIQLRARVKPRFQSTSKATVCIFDTVALLFEAHTQPQPHFLLPRVSGNNWWWMTSIRKQMIQKRKKSLNNCRYHTMSGIPTGLHVRHSLHIQNLGRLGVHLAYT